MTAELNLNLIPDLPSGVAVISDGYHSELDLLHPPSHVALTNRTVEWVIKHGILDAKMVEASKFVGSLRRFICLVDHKLVEIE